MKRSGSSNSSADSSHLMQKRLRWYGHVRRRYESHTTKGEREGGDGGRERERASAASKQLNHGSMHRHHA